MVHRMKSSILQFLQKHTSSAFPNQLYPFSRQQKVSTNLTMYSSQHSGDSNNILNLWFWSCQNENLKNWCVLLYWCIYIFIHDLFVHMNRNLNHVIIIQNYIRHKSNDTNSIHMLMPKTTALSIFIMIINKYRYSLMINPYTRNLKLTYNKTPGTPCIGQRCANHTYYYN